MKDFDSVTRKDVLFVLVERMAEELSINDGNANAEGCLAVESVASELMNERQLDLFHDKVQLRYSQMMEEE